MESETSQIQAACENYNRLADVVHRARAVDGRYPSAGEITARNAARTDLIAVLTGAGYGRCYTDRRGKHLSDGIAYTGRTGHVQITESGVHCGASAKFASRTTVAAAMKTAAIRARVASDERNY